MPSTGQQTYGTPQNLSRAATLSLDKFCHVSQNKFWDTWTCPPPMDTPVLPLWIAYPTREGCYGSPPQ